MNRALLRQLQPARFGSPDVEAIADYLSRVRSLLPNFPDSVIAQWLHRHYNDAVSDYGWLGLDALTFTRESWVVGRLKVDVTSFKNDLMDRIGHWTHHFQNADYAAGNWLIEAMKRSGTWPEPILVLQNDSGYTMPNGLALGTPFHLVEGHHRLGFLWAMQAAGSLPPTSTHDIWVLGADHASVSKDWPNI